MIFSNFIKIFNTSSEDPGTHAFRMLRYKIVFSVLAGVSAVLTLLNIHHHYYFMAINTAVLVVGFLAAMILTAVGRNVAAKHLVAVLLSFIFTIFAVTGGNFGFAITWIILVPLLTMGVLGYRIGFFTSLYFQILLFALFFTPLKYYVSHYYTRIFMERFPFVYLAGYICSAVLMYQLHADKIKLLSQEDVLKAAIEAERKRVSDITLQTILSISNAVDAKDKYTQEHSKRVSEYSGMIAEALGWESAKVNQLKQIALLHDIGKISISDSILNKKGKLTDEEYEIMKTHTINGSRILKDLSILPNVNFGTKYHHERYDGKGYPEHLKGEEIPIEGRIIGLADAFDAMNSNRIYRNHLTADQILDELQKNRGTQFDPQLVDAFLPIAKQILELIY